MKLILQTFLYFLAQGLSDLVTCPLEEYQRVDGQLSRGIQKGTASFGLNAASAAIDATQRMMGFVHVCIYL